MHLSKRSTEVKGDLGSPVREICTPGSKWGDEHKGPCRLGEATDSKETALARLRKGYRSKACPYPPSSEPRSADGRRLRGG